MRACSKVSLLNVYPQFTTNITLKQMKEQTPFSHPRKEQIIQWEFISFAMRKLLFTLQLSILIKSLPESKEEHPTLASVVAYIAS